MTKKLTLPLFIALYLISLAAGFGFAGIRQANAITPTSATHRQISWVVVRVDDMTIEQPRLVSVWAMFLTFSPGPQVFFKPLFSSASSTNHYPDLGIIFSVTADRSISNKFMNELNRLMTHQSGMVILDDIGYELFTSWFTQPVTANETRPFVPQTGIVDTRTFRGEIMNYGQICTTLENTSRPSLASLPWRELYPNHLASFPTLQSLANLWERLILSDLAAHCEVIEAQ